VLPRLPIVGLFGSGTKITPERAALARDIGMLVARLGSHLLTGASYAITESAAEGFVSVKKRRGVCIGTLGRATTAAFDRPRAAAEATQYPNRHVELVIYTTLPVQSHGEDIAERHRVNLISSNAVIALPGSVGTHDELQMAATFDGESAKKPDERRTILIGPTEEFSRELRHLFAHAPTIADAERHICHVLALQGFLVERLMPKG
jgi:predicted Rossmann-fold nucleotide-binding protein